MIFQRIDFHQRRRQAVLDLLQRRAVSGRDLRSELGERGYRLSLPAFYSMMADMEDEGIVTHEVETKVIQGCEIKSRIYRKAGWEVGL